MFEFYDSLGFDAPYYTVADGRNRVERHIADTLIADTHIADTGGYLPARQLDVAAVVEVISRYHCFGDRTLIQGVRRVPWMAKPAANGTDWEYADLPLHGDQKMESSEVAKILFARLQEEILTYCEGRSTVGLLLSGGMDSRMVAGVLDSLLKTGQTSVRVVAITWGREKTRDVVYAQQLAQRLGWEWVHLPISAETLFANIAETAKHGCEYSPVHLHAMPAVRDMQGIDCVLGASYGDSIGRAEYSGNHITQLPPFQDYTLNWFHLLHRDVYSDALKSIEQDVRTYQTRFPRPLPLQQHEIDWQAHYMRRKLNHCMGVINENAPLFQVFTSPKVFGFMWSLSPLVRNDAIYRELLGMFQTDMADIPWARTGAPYLGSGKPVDSLPSQHHQYGTWIRNELYPMIQEKVLSRQIESLGIFNMQALESALALNLKLTRHEHTSKIDEIAIWLAALADFVELYDVKAAESVPSMLDTMNGFFVSPLQVAGLAATKFILKRK